MREEKKRLREEKIQAKLDKKLARKAKQEQQKQQHKLQLQQLQLQLLQSDHPDSSGSDSGGEKDSAKKLTVFHKKQVQHLINYGGNIVVLKYKTWFKPSMH